MENYITEVDILQEAKDCFLTYAEEVLTDRAIPNAEDGLLSAQRKLLWTMKDYLKMDSSSKTKKCNSIVGSTLLTSYFHGDQACYGVLCKMSQDYLMRYPLITGQGALGTQEDNSMYASSRYTEAKPSQYADAMFNDFDKNVVPLKETYNGEFMEPVILPSIFPNALANGREAIGISMSHNSLPNNLTEICDGIIEYIKNKDITTRELMNYIKGPDFPLGGTIINQKDIYKAYETGKSDVSLKIRGDYTIEGQTITFTSIPYRTYRNKIKAQINDNIESFEKYVEDFNDESSIGENRLIFKVKKDIDVNTALEMIFKLTDLQSSVSYNMNFIINGTPQLCSLKKLIEAYVKHQISVLLKATEYDKQKAENRVHIIDGLLAAIDKIDEVIQLIKQSQDKAEARNKIMQYLNIDDIQANAILDMKLSRLTRIDKHELISEKQEKEKIIAECNLIIQNEEHRNNVLIDKITILRKKYGDARRTKLINLDIKRETTKEPAIEPEKCVVISTKSGLIKRIPVTSFKPQTRNTVGTKSQDDIASTIIRTNTVDSLMIFTNKAKMYRLSVNDIPVGTNTSRGQSIKALIEMAPDEKPEIIYSIYKDTQEKYVVFITKQGLIKRTALDDFVKTKRASGIAATTFNEGDSLASVFLATDEDVFAITKEGMGIRFSLTEVAPTSRAAKGIKGVGLHEGDEVRAATPIRDESDDLGIFSEQGCAKRIPLSQVTKQKRGGKGLSYGKTETPAAVVMLAKTDTVLIVGDKSSLCLKAADITETTRSAVGVHAIKNNKIIGVSKV